MSVTYTARQVAELLGVSVRKVQRYAKEHKIGKRVWRCYAFSEAAVGKLKKLMENSQE